MSDVVTPEIIVAGAVVGVGGDLIRRLLGPAVDEMGHLLADPIRAYREKRLPRLLSQAKEDIDQSGKEVRQVEWKVAIQILDGGTLEEEDEIVEMWGHLLASAGTGDRVLPAFPHLLRQLSPDEARLLSWVLDAETSRKHRFQCRVVEAREVLGISRERAVILVSNLVRLGLLMINSAGRGPALMQNSDLNTDDNFALSVLGREFVVACCGPAWKAPEDEGSD